ncbi:MAG: GTP-binding protein [Candidatus Helarchaeota archaeon]|nr:GTP-binding protein [Candidatus Helarchaeota archaeon]
MPQTLGNKLNILLDNYLNIHSILIAAIMDTNGLIIASSITHEEEELTIAACSGALSRAANRIKRELSSERSHLGAIVTTEQGQLIFTQAGKNAFLITLIRPGSDTDKILPWTYVVAEKIQQIIDFEDPNISLEIEFPQIKNRKDFFFKLVILGNESVGKTSILRRFIEKKFDEDYKSTIGVGIQKKAYKLSDNISVILNIWDLSGQMMFRNIRKTYLEGSDSAVIVYDVTRPRTFEDISNWLEELKEALPPEHKFLTILVGNKIDLERKVSNKKAKDLAKSLNIPYLETSAKTGDNVDKAFGALCYYLIKDSVK